MIFFLHPFPNCHPPIKKDFVQARAKPSAERRARASPWPRLCLRLCGVATGPRNSAERVKGHSPSRCENPGLCLRLRRATGEAQTKSFLIGGKQSGGFIKHGGIEARFNAQERWLSGRKRLIANPLYELYSYRGFESLSLRKLQKSELLCKETGGDFAMPGSSQLRRADEGVRVLATRRGIAPNPGRATGALRSCENPGLCPGGEQHQRDLVRG